VLGNFFSARAIAVVGASRTPGKIGYDVLRNIIQYGYEGQVYPINPEAHEILGKKVYPSLLDVPGVIDLALVVVPPKKVLDTIDQCGAKKIDSAIIITAGFRESGIDGLRLEQELITRAKRAGVRFIGPNCLGIIDTHAKINASFAAGMPERGSIGFFSQSGALCLAVLDRALPDGLGFSKFISMGNKADITDTDVMLALSEDDRTKVILGYIEGLSDGRKFMEVARLVSQKKPVIILKSGITASGAKAASSHTGALAGREAAFDAAFKQSGIIRAHTLNELFNFAIAFAHQPLPRGPNVAVITNSGGPGILTADACDKSNLQLTPLHKEFVDELRTFLPAVASFYNPIDILGDSGADRYERTLKTVLKDEKMHSVVVLLTPTAVVDVDATAHAVIQVARMIDRPVLTSFMGKLRVEESARLLLRNGVPNYSYPEEMVSSLNAMYRYHLWLQKPQKHFSKSGGYRERAVDSFRNAQLEHRGQLNEREVRSVLDAYGFKQPESLFARTPEEAVAAAKEIGFPVVMKIVSPQISHKSDIGGVRINLRTKRDVEDTFFEITTRVRNLLPSAHIDGVLIQEMVQQGREVIIGITSDPQFGHLIMFGMGGIYVEVLRDVSFRVAPLSAEDAHEMIRETLSFPLLRGVRGEAEADIEAIEHSLLVLSQMTSDFPEIVEADINPLLVQNRGEGLTAIDARFTIGGD
jgi:acetyltransferase